MYQGTERVSYRWRGEPESRFKRNKKPTAGMMVVVVVVVQIPLLFISLFNLTFLTSLFFACNSLVVPVIRVPKGRADSVPIALGRRIANPKD
jgi:hypothetical protein